MNTLRQSDYCICESNSFSSLGVIFVLSQIEHATDRKFWECEMDFASPACVLLLFFGYTGIKASNLVFWTVQFSSYDKDIYNSTKLLEMRNEESKVHFAWSSFFFFLEWILLNQTLLDWLITTIHQDQVKR